jgi:hypothetical protein
VPGAGEIDRFCFVRLAAEYGAERAAIAARLRDAFVGAPGVLAVSAGLPADDSAAKWDVSLVVRCVDLAAWQALAASPAVAELLGEWLPARAAVVKAWTFSVL